MKYIALLRGINVGGKAKVSMEELRHVFERIGFTNVKTYLNSGNVTFEVKNNNEDILRTEIALAVERQFGFPIHILIRSRYELERLVKADPFKDIRVRSDTRLYVTFFSDQHTYSQKDVQKIAGKDAAIVSLTDREICSVITVAPEKNTTDLMKFLERTFGKKVTTRNWNTIVRLLEL